MITTSLKPSAHGFVPPKPPPTVPRCRPAAPRRQRQRRHRPIGVRHAAADRRRRLLTARRPQVPTTAAPVYGPSRRGGSLGPGRRLAQLQQQAARGHFPHVHGVWKGRVLPGRCKRAYVTDLHTAPAAGVTWTPPTRTRRLFGKRRLEDRTKEVAAPELPTSGRA